MTETRQWEYYVETVGSAFKGVSDEELLDFLNDLGSEGWEVFNIYKQENSVKIRVMAKRPMKPSQSKQRRSWP
jgi:hypothetical protein